MPAQNPINQLAEIVVYLDNELSAILFNTSQTTITSASEYYGQLYQATRFLRDKIEGSMNIAAPCLNTDFLPDFLSDLLSDLSHGGAGSHHALAGEACG